MWNLFVMYQPCYYQMSWSIKSWQLCFLLFCYIYFTFKKCSISLWASPILPRELGLTVCCGVTKGRNFRIAGLMGTSSKRPWLYPLSLNPSKLGFPVYFNSLSFIALWVTAYKDDVIKSTKLLFHPPPLPSKATDIVKPTACPSQVGHCVQGLPTPDCQAGVRHSKAIS